MTDDALYYGANSSNADLSPAQVKGGEPNVTGAERWLSILADGAIATAGARRGDTLGVIAAVAGGALIARGVAQNDPVKRAFQPSPFEEKVARRQGWSTAATAGYAVSINRPRQEIFEFFREFSNLPRFMENVESIEMLDRDRSRWTVKAPGGQTVTWVATVTSEEPGRRIAWEAEEQADVRNAGWIEFKDGPAGRGTEVKAMIAYEPPFGQLGRVAAKITRKEPAVQARGDLKRLKMLMEAGEVSTARINPTANNAA